MITSHLDYLVKSFQPCSDPEKLLPNYGGWKITKELGKVRQYSDGYLLECGGLLLLSMDEQQGSLVELSGEPLGKLRETGETDLKILTALAAPESKRTTRIDYAWNLDHPDITVQDTLKEWNKKRFTTRMRQEPIIYATNDKKDGMSQRGMTVYYGSKLAPHRVIVYDKAAELQLLNQALLRVELRVRAPQAPFLADDMKKHGVLTAAQYKLRQTLDFPKLKWWQELYTGEVVQLSKYKPGAKNALNFLANTMDPFIMNNIEDRAFRVELENLIGKWAEALAAKEDNDHDPSV